VQPYPRRLFSREFRRQNVRAAAIYSLLSLLPAAAGGAGSWLLVFRGEVVLAAASAALGMSLAIVLLHLIGELLGLRGYPELRRALARRLAERGIDVSEGLFVGYSPGAHPALFEGDTNFDVGFLLLCSDELRYYGDALSFALPKEQIAAIRLTAPLQGIRRTVICWRAPDTGLGAMTLEPLDVRTIGELRRACRPLAQRLLAWWGGEDDLALPMDLAASADYVRAYGGEPLLFGVRPTALAHALAALPSSAALVAAAWAAELRFGSETATRWLIWLVLGFFVLHFILANRVQRALDGEP